MPSFSRLVFSLLLISFSSVLASALEVPVKWLDATPPLLDTAVSFGVLWTQGTVKKEQAFKLTGAEGVSFPVQSWSTAFWPDGSVKWTGIGTVVAAGSKGPFTLSTTAPTTNMATEGTIKVKTSETGYEIETGKLKVRIPKWGTTLIDSMSLDGLEIARNGQLVCVLQDGPDGNAEDSPVREKFTSKLEKVTVEQSGPVRAVLKLEGRHRSARAGREWLPFVVRLYFFAGQESVRMVHTIVYDGNEQKDFIRGLGVVFDVPLREEMQNRQVRFSGEGDGLWSEPVEPMVGRGGRFVAKPGTKEDLYPTQLSGQRVPARAEVDQRGQNFLEDWAVWDSFKLMQPNADGFTIVKRTNADSCWLAAGAGKRASGLVYVGDASGGLAVGLKNFWQSYPASLEVRGASGGSAQLMVWLWSPDAPAMDMRHYDTRAHGLDAVYEDVQPGMSIPLGVARTSELMLFPQREIPTKLLTTQEARATEQPAVLVCTPQYLQSAHAFGLWGLEDRSTPVKRAIEEHLDATVNYYLTQPDQRNWYGFWDFGDVMHSYDNDRHVWRYDLGGMAWDNSELGTDMWLWYSFLHTGRADIFRMAEAMTRHTGEVDCYHLGPFAGLGSRHNVRHWGCGAKEARISQAAYRRFYYYLSTDERIGDVMREMVNADFKTIEFDPMRLAQPITVAEKKLAPTRVRLGPDWLAFLGNWMTEWERTGDTKWRDKIMVGVESLGEMPLGLRSGKNLVFGYDPTTGRLTQLNDEAGVYNLATIMGGAEVVFELNTMLNDALWDKLWLEYCRLYNAPKEVVERDRTTGNEGEDAAFVRDGRLAGYVYTRTNNPAFARAAVTALLEKGRGRAGKSIPKVHALSGPEVLRPIDESPLANTNSAAQNGLETITMLGMVGSQLPTDFPAEIETPKGPGRSSKKQ